MSKFFCGCFTTVWWSIQPVDLLCVIVVCGNGEQHHFSYRLQTEEIQYLLPQDTICVCDHF